MTIKASNISSFTSDISSYARNAQAARATTEAVNDYHTMFTAQTPIATYAVVVANEGYVR